MEFTVPSELEGISVKNFLRRHCQVSARLLAKLKRTEGGLLCQGQPVRSIDILHGGDILCLTMPEEETHIAVGQQLPEVAYEDSSVIVYYKPAGIPVHPTKIYQQNTLANQGALYQKSRGESYPFRAVNRLDRDTSGLIICGKNRYSANYLRTHTKKWYTALCEGRIETDGTINAPIRLKPGHSIQREVGEGGQAAVTHYEVIEHYGEEFTLLRLWLETGRTHQIRVHLSSEGHPLAGDDLYGGSRRIFQRQCLHCGELEFTQPETGEKIRVERKLDFWEPA